MVMSRQRFLRSTFPPFPRQGMCCSQAALSGKSTPQQATPIRANFQLRFTLTSPALPAGIVLRFGVPLTFFRNNTGTGGGFQGGISTDAEALTRKLLAGFLLTENPGLTEATARQIADDLFKQGFHVSVFARLRSQNITDATRDRTATPENTAIGASKINSFVIARPGRAKG